MDKVVLTEYESEKVILEAPLSFTGATKRLWRLSENGWVRWLLLLPLIFSAWAFVGIWYLLFGIFLIPYRLLRRSQRRQRQENLRHQELMRQMAHTKTG